MSYHITSKDIAEWSGTPTASAAPTPPRYHITPQDMREWSSEIPAPTSPQYGTLHNLGAGFVNPFIHALNLLPEAATGAAHALGFEHFHDPLIKSISSTPGLARDVGNIAGFVVPFGEAAKGIEGVTALAREAPVIGRGIEGLAHVPGVPLAGRLGQTALAGGVTGAVTSPATRRERGAVGGAIGGGIGGLGGEILGGTAQAFSPSAKRISAGALKPLHNFFNASIRRVTGTPATQALEDSYEGAKSLVNWDSLKPLAKEASKAGEIDYGTYQNEFNKILKEARTQHRHDPDVGSGLVAKLKKLSMEKKVEVPPQEQRILLPGQLITKGGVRSRGYAVDAPKPLPPEVKQLRPMASYNDVVDIKKNINNLANWDKSSRDTENRLARVYSGRLGGAIDKMVAENALQRGDPEGEPIRKFAGAWGNQRQYYGRLQQFYTDPTTKKFSQRLKDTMENKDYEKAMQGLVPRRDEDMTKINHLAALIGNPEEAQRAILHKGLQPYLDNTGKMDTLKLGQAINKQRLSPALGRLLNEPELRSLEQITRSQEVEKELAKDPGVMRQLAQHPFFAAAGLGAISHFAGLPYEMSGIASTAGLVAPRVGQRIAQSSAERKAARLIVRGEWNKLKGLGEEIRKGRSRKAQIFPGITGALGSTAGVAQGGPITGTTQ